MERRIRKITAYLCTECFQTFPDNGSAKAHWQEEHHVPKPKRPRGRPPKKRPSERKRAVAEKERKRSDRR
ncbi:MAG: hypothetical protein KY455_08030 [Euryarchaeota archaeon]|nr:hypothetical protein [Euryarchaeota archaeon]